MKMQVTVEFKDLRNACREEQRWFLDTYGGEVILTKENLASTEAWRVEWLADNVFSCGDVFRQRKREYLYLIDHESSYENGKCGGCVVEGILNSELLLSIIEFREFNKTEFFSRLRAHEVKAALGPTEVPAPDGMVEEGNTEKEEPEEEEPNLENEEENS